MKLIDGTYGTKYWDLFEQRINETVDSIQTKTIPKLRRISLHITNKCNFNCIYCNETHNNKELDFNLFKKIIDEYSESGGVLHITGGEPSLVSYINEAIDDAYKKKNIVINLNTNCYKLILDESYQKLSRLKISFDTYNEQKFDSIVQRKNAFKQVINNINYIKNLKNSPIISITYTVNAKNIEDILEYAEFYYKNMRVYALFFSIYKGNNKELIFTNEHKKLLFEQIYPKLKEIMLKYNDLDSLWLLQNSHAKHTYNLKNRFLINKQIPCYLSLSELSIYEDGRVSHCSHLSRDNVFDDNLNIYHYSLNQIMKNKHNLLKNIPLHNKCLYGCNLKLCKFNLECHKKLINI